jgi:hypothetical protein
MVPAKRKGARKWRPRTGTGRGLAWIEQPLCLALHGKRLDQRVRQMIVLLLTATMLVKSKRAGSSSSLRQPQASVVLPNASGVSADKSGPNFEDRERSAPLF